MRIVKTILIMLLMITTLNISTVLAIDKNGSISDNIINISYNATDIVEDIADVSGNYSDLIEDMEESQNAPSNITEEYNEADQIVDLDIQEGEKETNEQQSVASGTSDQHYSFLLSIVKPIFLFIIVVKIILIIFLVLRKLKK